MAPPLIDWAQTRLFGVTPDPPSADATALHRSLTIADMHADSLIWGRPLLERNARGQVDIPRLQDANVAVQIFAVPAKLILTSNLALSPVVLPLLSPPATARFASALGLDFASAERVKSAPIPQLLADRTAWESFVDEVQRVYLTLPEADRARTVIYAPSYEHFGALERFGPAHGRPRPHRRRLRSGHAARTV